MAGGKQNILHDSFLDLIFISFVFFCSEPRSKSVTFNISKSVYYMQLLLIGSLFHVLHN